MPKKAFMSISESKRKRVMDCALLEFSKHKYHKASINGIVKCAEIPRGSFYQYFEDKEDLFFYMVENIFQSELEIFFREQIEKIPEDPFHFHQIIFRFNLHMLSDERYRDFFRNLFLVLNYRFTCRYKEIIDRQRDIVLAKLGLKGSETGKRIKETLEICSLITMELLAMKSLDGLSDEEIWSKYYERFQIIGWEGRFLF